MKIKEVVCFLDELAPLCYQESYDNVGLLVGDPSQELQSILTTLDVSESTLEEAKKKGSNLIVSHHPIIFKGLTRLTGRSLQERLIVDAIKSQIALYAMHTNLDNLSCGLNMHAAHLLKLSQCRILRPKRDTLSKLETLLPEDQADQVLAALHEAGAGSIGPYTHCSFRSEGLGTFLPGEGANPFVGKPHQLEKLKEIRLELILPSHRESAVLEALLSAHPYEQPAYYFTRLSNQDPAVGSGVVGHLPTPLSVGEFLQILSDSFGATCIRHTSYTASVERVAFCGGASSFLLPDAFKSGAQAFVSADLKYHDFFDAPPGLLLCDIGHAESEEHVKRWISDQLKQKFPNIAVQSSSHSTNPIHYFIHGK